jgi:hypothetical protein
MATVRFLAVSQGIGFTCERIADVPRVAVIASEVLNSGSARENTWSP